MIEDAMREEDLFAAALEIPAGAERDAYLRDACAANDELRERVLNLLARHEKNQSFLGHPPSGVIRVPFPEPSAHDAGDRAEKPSHPEAGRPETWTFPNDHKSVTGSTAAGQIIAQRYKLEEKIGEGGMGEVWAARQIEPVKRRVALKLIKSGMNSRAMLARFEQERQALAVMDHQNIARIYDGGLTPTGQPFFVMELVNGLPLNRFCDEARLTPRERLALFVNVCDAIQHAHQKGIIHRDLKPANILVTVIDGRPVPKVIDFGVSKATAGKLTEETLNTQFGAIVGTLEYMAPEQTGFSGVDIDTRADIYALGVILYELLTGVRPIDSSRLKRMAVLEMMRVIQEEEPSRPSTRLSSEASLPTLAALRQTEPKRLAAMLRGELDWVVMRCLEKRRDSRYETASGLAQDIQRFLDDQPVEARPPSTVYRVQKFIRRNRRLVIAASMLLVALVGGLIGTAWGLLEARRATIAERDAKWIVEQEKQVADDQRQVAERERKKADEQRQVAEAVRDFLQAGLLLQANVTAQADALMAGGGLVTLARPNVTVRELLDRTTGELTDERLNARFPGQPLVHAGLLQTAGNAYVGVGDFNKAIPLLRRASSLNTTHLGTDSLQTLVVQQQLAHACLTAGMFSEALDLSAQVAKRMASTLGPSHRETLNARNTWASALLDAGRTKDALAEFESLVPELVSTMPNDPTTLGARSGLAKAVWKSNQRDRALTLYQQAYDAKRTVLGEDHPVTLAALIDFSVGLDQGGKPAEAMPLFEEARKRTADLFGEDHPTALIAAGNLAGAYDRRGQTERALPLAELVYRRFEATLGPDHPDTCISLDNLALYVGKSGQAERSLSLYQRVVDIRKKNLPSDHPDLILSRANLAIALGKSGQWERAVVELESVLAARIAKLGADHPLTLGTQSNLAFTYLNVGPPERAVSACEEAVRRTKAVLGERSPGALKAREYLAAAYQKAGRTADAIVVQKPLVADLTATLGPDHPTTQGMEGSLGLMLIEAGRNEDAESLLRKLLTAREKSMSKDWRTANARSLLGAALLGQKKYSEAEPLLIAGYESLKMDTGSPLAIKHLKEALERLIKLADATNRPTQSAQWRAELEKLNVPRPRP
jgi:serine/threonine protein kinase